MKEESNNIKKHRVCPVCGKVHNYPCKENLCLKHYTQKLRFGKFLDNTPRSIYDPNEYRVEGDITYISVYDKYGNKLDNEVLIDTKNIPIILKYKVYIRISNKGNIPYAYCNVSRNNKVKVHQIICPSINTVDHINGNPLDNRESNLREANMNIQNLNKVSTKGIQKQINRKGNTTGYAATMCYKGKRYLSKYYKKEEEAMYYRYLLLQLLPFQTNYDLSFMYLLTQEQKDIINRDFENRFKNRVLQQACHLHLNEHLSEEQYTKLIDFCVAEGVNYFTFNIPISECKNCGHVVNAPVDTCPKCSSTNIDKWVRIIGFLRPISSFSEARQIEAGKRVYSNKI